MAEESKTCPSFDSRMICKSRAKDSCCATAGSSSGRRRTARQGDHEGNPLAGPTFNAAGTYTRLVDIACPLPRQNNSVSRGSGLKAQVAASKWWPHVSYNHAP
ncbi:unnamed protein product [Fusarium graminearum]|uniref:Chromosome 3, complete genome n=1 Tax=Gibberella zeae (strain ATCC MYA-4620 / CBS 123657 / FGSC 9075 / NRRL 31084 / PH-1) TaxID=229533 RepID=I1S7L5_GIBZE|nr:hypothetical protein FGSG_12838 [Fusarium graminearum PH-1]ESU11930.1 hypothetical protein FGSG_12838 [Fusarium graminearum PH-1]EYB33411.1 hypothetical protein FG05_12838 [Fusarium graminearum]CEF86564.1 unnamed protein product [Fusarium graminearum]CZS84613.1 unnamed protein product [Fusarium graminearum]|eukprot:XP_011324506.1 hypothetical protein FGSG_12838 [Fusarium graminearum PH-1]